MENNKRVSNLEILRIIAMFLIVVFHYGYHGFKGVDFSNITFNKCLVDILSLWGKIGVNLFVLISAYFMVDKKFTLKKFVLLDFSCYFYGALGLILSIIFNTFSFKYMIRCFMPITLNLYWFVTDYVVLMLLSPFINVFINNADQKTYTMCIVSLVGIFSLVSTIFTTVYTTEIIWFVIMYVLAGYIKKFEAANEYKKYLVWGGLWSILLVLISVCLNLFSAYTDRYLLSDNATYLAIIQSPIVLIISVNLFKGFLFRKPFYNEGINKAASLMFGVYLIHDNFIIRGVIWEKLLKNKQFYNTPYLLIHAVFGCVLVFTISACVECIRKHIFEKQCFKIFDKYYIRIEEKFKVIFDKFTTLIVKIWE